MIQRVGFGACVIFMLFMCCPAMKFPQSIPPLFFDSDFFHSCIFSCQINRKSTVSGRNSLLDGTRGRAAGYIYVYIGIFVRQEYLLFTIHFSLYRCVQQKRCVERWMHTDRVSQWTPAVL